MTFHWLHQYLSLIYTIIWSHLMSLTMQRHYHKLEGYTMQPDGYVLDVTCVDYSNGYIALKSHVKPRTCDKDPVSKLSFYSSWIIVKNDERSTSCVLSAYCSCRGGMDGCCRHVTAMLFDFTQDFSKKSCTSGPCQWIRRASEAAKLSQPIPATDLNTS
ncbi:uncharacterized protein LOC128556868 [Mercenaria mercenaria]|uniref:uncharacterized protein LOC128556868 n=1 Tax=Mercenaria mercenaria TaxID=6596 RepID=UPI00234E51D6|nr:uncharacterized protein LOC128556868 [Mercenaria mercenaria]